MVAPKGFFQSIDRESYVQARLTVSKKNGVLRFTIPALLLAAIFVVSGVQTLLVDLHHIPSVMNGAMLICVAIILVAIFLRMIPQQVKKNAAKDFDVYNQLSNHVQVTMTADELLLQNEVMTRRTEFAKTRLCIETPARFILITDEDAMIVMEKARFEDRAATEEFLRDVCARWYVKRTGE